MRTFLGLERHLWPVPTGAARLLSRIDRGSGTEERHRRSAPLLLDSLAERTRVESVRASCAIEDIVVDPARLARLSRGEAPRSRSEEEVAGYRDALDHVLGAGRDEQFGIPFVLRLHRLLFAHTDSPGGRLEEHDDQVVDRLPDGRQVERFRTVPARETEFHLRELHARLDEAIHANEHHPILVAGAYVFDLLVIHPFDNGNGRVARLTTTSLLERAGYGVVRYVSVEGLIDRTSDAYDRTLKDSTVGWHEGHHDLWPWLTYLLERVAEAYDEFERQTAAAASGTKTARVEEHVLRSGPATFSRDELRVALPGVSDATILRTLQRLRQAGVVEPLGRGPTARWRRR